MMSLAEAEKFLEAHFTRSVFRLETLNCYDDDSDGNDVTRYLAGEAEPAASARRVWLDELRDDAAAGKLWQRLHVLRTPLTDYLRYECEWSYAYNVAAGEDVRILDLTGTPRPAGLGNEEFALIDDAHVLLMRYTSGGKLLGADLAPQHDLEHYRRCRDAALSAAIPFQRFWAAHPEEHRDNRLSVRST